MIIQKNNLFKNILPYILLAVVIVSTLLFFRNGQMVDKSVGVISEENLITKIQTLQNG